MRSPPGRVQQQQQQQQHRQLSSRQDAAGAGTVEIVGNWPDALSVLLVNMVHERRAVLFGNHGGSARGKDSARAAWTTVQAALAHRGLNKPLASVSKKFSNIKQSARKKRRAKLAPLPPGGGSVVRFTPAEDLYLRLFEGSCHVVRNEPDTNVALAATPFTTATVITPVIPIQVTPIQVTPIKVEEDPGSSMDSPHDAPSPPTVTTMTLPPSSLSQHPDRKRREDLSLNEEGLRVEIELNEKKMKLVDRQLTLVDEEIKLVMAKRELTQLRILQMKSECGNNSKEDVR